MIGGERKAGCRLRCGEATTLFVSELPRARRRVDANMSAGVCGWVSGGSASLYTRTRGVAVISILCIDAEENALAGFEEVFPGEISASGERGLEITFEQTGGVFGNGDDSAGGSGVETAGSDASEASWHFCSV